MRFHWSRPKKISLGAIVGLSLLAGLVFAALPEVARRLALHELEKNLVPPVSIEDIDYNPLTGRAQIFNFVVGATGDRRFLSIPRVEARISLFSFLRGNVTVRSLRLIRPELYLERTGPARFNVMELVRQPRQEHPGEQGSRGVTVESFMIEQGKIGFVDNAISPAFTRTLENVTLTTDTISTAPDLILTPTSFEMRLHVGAGSVTLSGKATPLARPVGIELTSRWNNLDPAIIQAYLPDHPALDFNGSWFSGELHYAIARQNKEVNYLTADIEIGPGNLLAAENRQPVLKVMGLSIEDVRWDFLSKHGQARRVIMKEPHLLIERGSNGAFNTTGLFGGDNASNHSPAVQENEEERSPSTFEIAHLETKGGTIEFLDRKVKPAIKATFHNVELVLQHFSLAPSPAQVEAKAFLGEAPVHIKGTLQTRPFMTRLQIASKNLPMEPYQGYLRLLWQTVDEWEGSLDGQVQLALTSVRDSDRLSLDLSGNLDARKVALGLPGAPETPFHADAVNIQLATLRTHPAFFMDIRRVTLLGADLRLRRDRDGNLNLRPLWARSAEGNDNSPGPKDSPDLEPPFTIQRLEARQSSMEFVDATVNPLFRTTLGPMTLEMGKLGRGGGRTPLNIQATLAESAGLQLKGWIELFDGPAQINLDGMVRDYDLSQLNPYATNYIRYEVDRGRVTTDVQYTYNAGDLAGQNKIAIRQLQMGDRLGDEFEKRIGVSLSLAIALLQDADGQIRLTVPVSGNLTDPQFDFGGLIWNALQNALVRLLSAPLRFLGSVVTSSGGKIAQIRIEPVEFTPGTTELTPKAQQQLTQLAQLMKSKPKVELEIHGFAAALDVEAIKKRRFGDAVKAEGGDYEKAVARLYRRAKGINIFASLPTLQEMESYLTAITAVSQENLDDLANRRVQVVENSLTAFGVDSGRLWPESRKANPNDESPGRIEFRLKS